jgi:hypothetical protein
MKSKPGVIPWHSSKDRATSACLHRLRNNHIFLNSFAHRIYTEANLSCQHVYPAKENPNQQVLIDWTFYTLHCQKSRNSFNSKISPLISPRSWSLTRRFVRSRFKIAIQNKQAPLLLPHQHRSTFHSKTLSHPAQHLNATNRKGFQRCLRTPLDNNGHQ